MVLRPTGSGRVTSVQSSVPAHTVVSVTPLSVSDSSSQQLSVLVFTQKLSVLAEAVSTVMVSVLDWLAPMVPARSEPVPEWPSAPSQSQGVEPPVVKSASSLAASKL